MPCINARLLAKDTVTLLASEGVSFAQWYCACQEWKYIESETSLAGRDPRESLLLNKDAIDKARMIHCLAIAEMALSFNSGNHSRLQQLLKHSGFREGSMGALLGSMWPRI